MDTLQSKQKAETLIDEFGDTLSVESILQQARGDVDIVTTDTVIAALVKDESRKISATTVKKIFCLKEDDIDHLHYDTVPNPHYRCAAPMRLFGLHDCLKVACEKHGSIAQIRTIIREKEHKSELRKRKRAENERARYNDRRQELIDAFTERNLDIRGDSRLCTDYLARKKGSVREAHWIAQVMDEMRFYKNHTKYDDFFVECRDAWLDYKGRYHRDEVSDEAKIKALHDWVQRHRNSIASMMLQEEFPPSLEEKVRRIIDE
jgi:hypothetical protein